METLSIIAFIIILIIDIILIYKIHKLEEAKKFLKANIANVDSIYRQRIENVYKDISTKSDRIHECEKNIRILQEQTKITIPTVDETGKTVYNSTSPIKAIVWALLGTLGLQAERTQSYIKLEGSEQYKVEVKDDVV